MKKIAIGVIIVAILLIMTASAAMAEQPPGIEPAVRIEGANICVVDFPPTLYRGSAFLQYSNGATGHTTWKCRMELISGEPVFWYQELSLGRCDRTISLEGNKGMWTYQCFDGGP